MSPLKVAWVLVALTVIAECHIAKRQVDTTHISDQDLISCFALLAEGRECNNFVNGNTPVTPPAPKPEQPGCQCVNRNMCLDDDGVTVSVGNGIHNVVDIRTICPGSFETCCTKIGRRPDPTGTGGPLNTVQRCGQLRPEGVDTTFVGFTDRQAQFGQFPWMVAVMDTSVPGTNGANVYVSGGSLISAGVVLTAAHYMTKYAENGGERSLQVRGGEWDFKVPNEPIPHQEAGVSRVLLHPDFVPNMLTYDVALLFLDRELPLGPTIGTICLPDPFETFNSRDCYGSGWGKDVFGQTGKFQQILKSIKLPMVNNNQCQNALRQTRLGGAFNLHDSFVCAGGQPGVDLCTGDGGSPLVCPRSDGSYVQTGVAAWGIGCGQDGLPGVYASVSKAIPWIGQELLVSGNFDIRQGAGLASNVNVRFGAPQGSRRGAQQGGFRRQ